MCDQKCFSKLENRKCFFLKYFDFWAIDGVTKSLNWLLAKERHLPTEWVPVKCVDINLVQLESDQNTILGCVGISNLVTCIWGKYGQRKDGRKVKISKKWNVIHLLSLFADIIKMKTYMWCPLTWEKPLKVSLHYLVAHLFCRKYYIYSPPAKLSLHSLLHWVWLGFTKKEYKRCHWVQVKHFIMKKYFLRYI